MGRDRPDFQLSECLGDPLQTSGQPGKEVRLWLGICTLPGTETGPVQNHLAAQVPTQCRHGERTAESEVVAIIFHSIVGMYQSSSFL